mmetsp:Transcript_38800/g.77295  ORF Transcript_38800/g.77295 Transcript_38800/m.77295 type:complete len:535 (+) Transcript_38800:178-1782(+)
MDAQIEISIGKPVRLPVSRKEKIQAELKLLEWHKLANAAAIKGALLQAKTTHTWSPRNGPQHTQDDERWIKRVIQEEHTKPLNVGKDFVLDYEKKEKLNADRLSHQVDRHISTLKTLRSKLETRNDLKTRMEEYRSWQRDFLPKKHAVMIGKTLEEYQSEIPPKTVNIVGHSSEMDSELIHSGALPKNDSHQDLSTVLDSLSRLADLEQRIAGLEKENQYDRMRVLESPGGINQRTSIEFRKKRQSTAQGPVGISYLIKPKNISEWPISMPVGGATNAARAYRQKNDKKYTNSHEDDGNGIFITAQDVMPIKSGVSMKKDFRQERARKLELATSGQKEMRGRLKKKTMRVQERNLGAKKHEAAVKEMARRKYEAVHKITKIGISAAAQNAVVVPSRGIGSGVHYKNKHLQELENLKTSYRRKKEAKERKSFKQELGTVPKRFNSQTVPACKKVDYPKFRAPNTKGAGTITRRANNLPSDKDPSVPVGIIHRLPATAPAIAVNGLGGLRALKATKIHNKRLIDHRKFITNSVQAK